MDWQSAPDTKQRVLEGADMDDWKIVAYGQGGQNIVATVVAEAPEPVVRQLMTVLDEAGWTVRLYRRDYHDAT